MTVRAGAVDSMMDASAELSAPKTYSAFSLALLWGGLSMSLLAFVPGAYLVPALSLRDAVLVAIGGACAGAALLAAVAAVAAKRRQNTVGLLSSTLGVPAGPWLALLLFARHTAWALFTIAFASEVAAQVPGLGGERWIWATAIAALALALALLPPAVFVRRWMGWFAFWVGLLIIGAVTATGVTTYGIPVVHDADGMGGWPSRAQGFDLIAALPILWAPVVADYAMSARRPRDAATGIGIGSGVMTSWYVIVGVLWVLTVSSRDVAGFISALPLGVGSLVVIAALEADTTAANLHAASLAGGRFGYRWFRPALAVAAVAAAAVAVAWDGFEVEDALLALGAIFLPLFAVILAREAIGPASRWLAWIGWIAGSLAYGWINPGWFEQWRDAMHFLFATVLRAPFPLGGEETAIPASIVSFAVAFGIYGCGALAARWTGRAHG